MHLKIQHSAWPKVDVQYTSTLFSFLLWHPKSRISLSCRDLLWISRSYNLMLRCRQTSLYGGLVWDGYWLWQMYTGTNWLVKLQTIHRNKRKEYLAQRVTWTSSQISRAQNRTISRLARLLHPSKSDKAQILDKNKFHFQSSLLGERSGTGLSDHRAAPCGPCVGSRQHTQQ